MDTGRSGERIAEIFLKKKGYKIIDRNYFCKKGEIDLIVKEKNTVVFVEIKTRNNRNYGLPSESITPDKIRHIKASALWYLTVNDYWIKGMECRFDVIEILRSENRQLINHIENAF